MLELGADVWGIEFLDEKVAEWRYRPPNDDRVRTGDLANLDFVDGAFDIIFMNEVLEHTKDAGVGGDAPSIEGGRFVFQLYP